MNTPEQLFGRFPYMFAKPNIAISIPTGWMPIFQRLCEDVDVLLGANKSGFRFSQCKEKFGSARWYWSMTGIQPAIRIDLISAKGEVTSLRGTGSVLTPPTSLAGQIAALVDAATKLTQHACIVCGAPGTGDLHRGWMLILCEQHAQQRRLGNLPTFWFE
jgi:hypothetical protein